MKQIHKVLPMPDDPYSNRYFEESCAFFDIETTGFSPKTAFVYLIGLAVRRADALHIYQFLAESRTEEAALLASFYGQLQSQTIDTLLAFNGLAFDLPFLKARERLYADVRFPDVPGFLDFYKLTGKRSHLFHLLDKKQKSVERFLEIEREDACTGGELIPLYYAFEKQPDASKESLLLLHNYEDVLGMIKLLPLLAYEDFFHAPINVLDASVQTFRPYEASSDEKELLLTLHVPVPLPKAFHYASDLCHFACGKTSARIRIPIYSGELRFYYENARDYYYLPDEDRAIHKSVAAFVDSHHKKKATKSTCYTRKTGAFLPQPSALFTPCFYKKKPSGISYFEMTEDILSNSEACSRYAAMLLDDCLHQKPGRPRRRNTSEASQ